MASALAGAMARGDRKGRDEASASPPLALGQEAAQPLAHGRGRDAEGLRGLSCAALSGNKLLDHFQSTAKGQSGMLMNVHPAGLLRILGVVVTSSFSNPVRMNHAYNLLKLHT